jgi:hypothetical protein
MPSPVVNAQSVLKVLRTFRERLATASPMSAKEWAEVPPEIRDGAFWSAKLEHAQHVAELKRASLQALRGARVRVGALRRGRELTGDDADETVLMSKGQIISEMRAAALERGLEPTGPREMEDIASAPRIGLIVDMAEKMTYGKARFESGNDPAVLDVWPAQELVRIEPRKEPRDWWARWQEAGEAVGWVGASRERMVALKSSPIWAALSEFDLPYPPFDYGSGMGVRDVERAVAVELGLMADDDEALAADAPDETRGSLKGLDETERDWLLAQFRDRLGDGVSIDGDEVVYRRR